MKAEAAARKNGAGGAAEMPGLWKAWNAKGRLPTLSTSPLEISPKGGVISTFPQLRRSGPAFATMTTVSHLAQSAGGLRPRPAALRAASGVIVVDREK